MDTECSVFRRKARGDEGPLVSLCDFPPCLGHKYLHPRHGPDFWSGCSWICFQHGQNVSVHSSSFLGSLRIPVCTTIPGDSFRVSRCDRFIHAMVACRRRASHRHFNIWNGTAKRLAHCRSADDLFNELLCALISSRSKCNVSGRFPDAHWQGTISGRAERHMGGVEYVLT